MYVFGMLTGFVLSGILFAIIDGINKITVRLEKRIESLEAKYRGWFKEEKEEGK